MKWIICPLLLLTQQYCIIIVKPLLASGFSHVDLVCKKKPDLTLMCEKFQDTSFIIVAAFHMGQKYFGEFNSCGLISSILFN